MNWLKLPIIKDLVEILVMYSVILLLRQLIKQVIGFIVYEYLVLHKIAGQLSCRW